MSHRNKVSLIGQVDARLQRMTQAGVGRSKHQDKIDGEDHKVYLYLEDISSVYEALLLFCEVVQRKSWLQDVERMSAARPRMD